MCIKPHYSLSCIHVERQSKCWSQEIYEIRLGTKLIKRLTTELDGRTRQYQADWDQYTLTWYLRLLRLLYSLHRKIMVGSCLFVNSKANSYHATLDWACDYLKLNHVNKTDTRNKTEYRHRRKMNLYTLSIKTAYYPISQNVVTAFDKNVS